MSKNKNKNTENKELEKKIDDIFITLKILEMEIKQFKELAESIKKPSEQINDISVSFIEFKEIFNEKSLEKLKKHLNDINEEYGKHKKLLSEIDGNFQISIGEYIKNYKEKLDTLLEVLQELSKINLDIKEIEKNISTDKSEANNVVTLSTNNNNDNITNLIKNNDNNYFNLKIKKEKLLIYFISFLSIIAVFWRWIKDVF